VVAVSAKSNVFSSHGEETRFKTLLRNHPQRFLQNMLSGLLSWTSANPNNYHKSSKIHSRQCALKLSYLGNKTKS